MSCLELFLQIIGIIVVLIVPRVENKGDVTCDNLKHPPFHEGNLGQTGVMPWLGVIRAYMHDAGLSIHIAVTGAVLIKPKHAIANAHDMSKIRKKGNSKAMFISSDRGTWTCKLGEVAIHPEYEFATYNTIALVELDTESLTDVAPMLPVCKPPYLYNTSDHLYAFGFTDENKLLEKVAYKVQYVEKGLCDEFYLRAGHGKSMYTPQLYECAFAENNLGNCEWENGMALASNASGHWVLVGFGVQGPGCSAPARFIAIHPYLRWIESASTVDDFDAEYPFKVKVRRADSIESIEDLDDDMNMKNYLKIDRITFNMTFREFLKEYKFLNKTTIVHEKKRANNETLNKVSSESVNDTGHLKNDKTQSDEFETFESEDKTENDITPSKTDNPDFKNYSSNAERLANSTVSV